MKSCNFSIFAYSAGEKATFDCSVESTDPSPLQLTWLHNNRPLDDRFADRIQVLEQGKTRKLVVMNCRPDDGGLYSAMAVNDQGATTCSASLVVEKRNKIQLFLQFKYK